MGKFVRSFIIWAKRRAPKRRRIITFGGRFTYSRFEFLWPDETIGRHDGKHSNRPPWWRPFNVFLHCWRPKDDGEEFHDHPRWSITLCLRGKFIEEFPGGTAKLLTPGSIAIRSAKVTHAVRIPNGHSGKTWTLFIVGRRNRQSRAFRFKPQV